MTRIKSYTVIEMLVVMLVSALSIGITYTCYRIFSNQYISYKNTSEEIAQYILLDRLLVQDVSKSEKIVKTVDGIKMKFKTREVVYDFIDTSVIRRDLITDTFKINPHELRIKFDTLSQNIPDHLVDGISFESTYKAEKLNFSYKKKYGADALMNIYNNSDQ